MPLDTDSILLGLKLQGTGNNENTWGDLLNEQTIVPIENAIAGYVEIAVDGGSDTLTAAQRRCAMIEFTGILAENQTITVANLSKEWLVKNSTTGAFTLSVKTSSGSAVEIRQGGWCEVWCDGGDNVYVGPSSANFATQMYGPDGTVSLPGYAFASDLNTGVRRKGDDNGCLVSNGADVLEWLTTGVNINGALAVSGLVTQGGNQIVPIGNMQPTARILAPTGWLFCYGQAISRTTNADLFSVLTITATATRNGTTGLTSVSVDMTGLGLEGSPIEGTGIASGTTISSLTSNTITLSQAASGSGSMTIRILPCGVGDGSTTFNVPDMRGRDALGRDNMGGTSANRLTGQTGGINGDRLNAIGGEETNTLTNAKMPAHRHPVFLTQLPHSHGYQGLGVLGGGANNYTSGTRAADVTLSSDANTIPITINDGAGTNNITAIVGDGEAHNNLQPGMVCNWVIFTGVFA